MLKFASDFVRAGSNNETDELTKKRNLFLATLSEQYKAAEDAVAGKQFKKSQEKKEKDADGNVVTVNKELRFIKNWAEGADGKFYYEMRYGGRRPLVRDGKPLVVECGAKLAGVPKVIGEIIAAVKAGDFDAELTALPKPNRKSKTAA